MNSDENILEVVLPRFREGDILKYFKYNQETDKYKYLYKFICEAIDTETKEEFVVYQAYWGDEEYYIKSKEAFYSKVDKEKYPDVKQWYEFELLDICTDCGKPKGNSNFIICNDCFSKVLDKILPDRKKDNNENK